MAVKISSLSLPKRIRYWVSLKSHLSSISCAIDIQKPPESDQNQSNCPDFDAKIQLLKNNLHPDNLVSVLDCTPDLNSSLNLFKWASLQKRFHHTSETYQKMILKLGMAGNLEEMEGFCKEMVREKCLGFEESLLSLIDSFLINHRFSEALRVLYVMNSTSFKPSISVFNSLMGALVDAKKDFKDVFFVYIEMVKAGSLPNTDTLNFLLEALFQAGKIETAVDQYKRMHKKGCRPNSRTFEILISGLCAEDRVEESIVILSEMFEIGCDPDSCFYSRVIPIFCGFGNLEIGMRLFVKMRASDIVPDSVTYGAIIRCLCEFHSMDDAIELYEEMVNKGLEPEHQMHLDLVNGFCKSRKFKEAKMFLEQKNVKDACAYNKLLCHCCDSGNFAMVRHMLDEMLEREIADSWSWNILIGFLCKNSLINKALECLCKMVISSFAPDATTYSALIIGNCNIGKVGHALDLFHYARSKSWSLDSFSYAEFVESLCNVGKTHEAFEMFCYMSSKGCALQSTVFCKLIENICGIGEVNRAIRLLSLAFYTGTAPLTVAYNSVLRGLSNSDKENFLLVILSQLIVVGHGFDGETYNILVQRMSGLNRARDCVSLLHMMLSEDFIPDPETLACLFSCLAKNSQMHLIFSSMDKLVRMPEILDSRMYNMLIDSLWREGHKSEACHLLDLMLEKGWVPDASTHALLMGPIARTDNVAGKYDPEDFGTDDKVGNILVEGLMET